jgi:acetyltransferase-like isoleucine patch superfamily enzyme
MLSGRLFYPFDKELCLERERCAAACWRFNNLTTPPTNGVSAEERARLFLEILQPRDPIPMSPTEASPVRNVGRVGRHVTVETPFTCDYGYNISIGNNVGIGRNCTIIDVCEVKIGDNCAIGPNVSIFTSTLPVDPKRRQGGQGPQSGKGITIEENCWIAGGAMILAGRTIGKGSTVGAGSVVTKVCCCCCCCCSPPLGRALSDQELTTSMQDVPPFTVVAGNPARVLRGIAS